jgi:hypothetical protein
MPTISTTKGSNLKLSNEVTRPKETHILFFSNETHSLTILLQTTIFICVVVLIPRENELDFCFAQFVNVDGFNQFPFTGQLVNACNYKHHIQLPSIR